jgi:hypothetical protein
MLPSSNKPKGNAKTEEVYALALELRLWGLDKWGAVDRFTAMDRSHVGISARSSE